jgi:hypothetical protein
MPAILAIATDAAGNQLRMPDGSPYYVTRNGPKTEMQLYTELTQAGYTGPQDIQSKLIAYDNAAQGLPFGGPSLATPAATAPITNNCAQCATGQNTGACSGCAPSTPPGYVTTGQGVPISTTSGLPFGFRPTSPVSIVGVTLPAWIWGAALAAGYFALKGGGRRR